MKFITLSIAMVSALALSACGAPAEEAASEVAEKEPMETVQTTPINPADTIDIGLTIGTKVPANASFATSEGQRMMSDILKDGPAVLVFTRSVKWCPFCQTQLKAINGIVSEIKEKGYNIYGVSYDSPDEQDRFAMNQMLEYQMLSDEKSNVIDAFGIRDPQYTEGRAVGVPYASVFMIAEDGTIAGKSISGDYKKRPTNEQLLMLLDNS